MPDREVKTIKDQIFFQYAKIIAKAAFGIDNGVDAKKKCYGFIKETFRNLKSGKMSWSDILREDMQFIDKDKECIYCGSKENLQKDHIVPKTLTVNERCCECDTIQAVHNIVFACGECNSKKSQKGLYTYWHEINPDKEKSFDYLPVLLEKKYLKTIYKCHECAGTLDLVIENIHATDIDCVINNNLSK